jgi:hypothetical protein
MVELVLGEALGVVALGGDVVCANAVDTIRPPTAMAAMRVRFI